MKLAFQVSTSPGALHSTTKSERAEILRNALLQIIKKPHQREDNTVDTEKGLQVTVNWAKKFIVLVTRDEADDWLPVVC